MQSKIKKLNYGLITTILIGVCFFFTVSAFAKDNVLVLHSFHQDYIETKKVQQGIKDSFAEQKINLHLEYMDSKRGFEKKHFQSLYQLYKHKYSTKNIDLVIAVNSNAFNFVKDYQEQLFKQTPIVFCSINKNIGALIDANSHYYGNNEKLDINSTVELALKLHPKREQLVAFFANNSSGTSNRKFFEEQVATNDSIAANKYQVYQVNNTQEIKKKIDQLGTNNIIYLGKISRGDDNQYITLRAVAQDLVDYSNSPIYSSWSFYLDYGIIGGKLINNYQEGENAAHLALKLLKGENTAALNMINSTKYMFDYNKLKEYNVSFNKLPSKNKIINSPQYFYQKNQKTFWFITVTIILLVIIIVLLLIYVVKYREIKEELEIEEERLRCAVQGSRIGIWDWNVKKDKVRCSSDFMEKLGFNSNIISNYLTTLKKRIHPQDRDEVIKKLTEELNKTDFYQAEYRWKVNEGWKWILDRGEVIQRDNEGEMLRVTGTYQDISFQKEIETELKRTKEKLENIFAHNNIVFFSLNVEDGDIIEISGSCTKVYGYQTQEFYDDSNLLSEVIYPEDEEIIEKKEELLKKKETGEEHLQFEYRIVKKNGEVRWVEEYTIPVRNYSKEVIRLDGIVTDITERKEAKERLKDRAYYDALTGVYNRHIGLQILEEEKRKLASGEKLSVCFVDVNNLKTVNDNYGHKEGDRLIKLVAMTVSREIRTSDKLIRLGGDEFLICFPQCDVELADKIWQRIRNKFRLINQKTNKPYQISASHGIAEYKGQQEISVEELITIADEKMYAEKQKMKEEKAENY